MGAMSMRIVIASVISALFLAGSVQAAPAAPAKKPAAASANAAAVKNQPVITTTTEKEVEVDENGKKVLKRMPTNRLNPGDMLVYTYHYSNPAQGELRKAVEVTTGIDKGVLYQVSSAQSTATGVDVLFSADGGKTFATADALMVEKTVNGSKQKQVAAAEQYTHLRWVIGELTPGAAGDLSFKVRVK